jgi:hypothetical protein
MKTFLIIVIAFASNDVFAQWHVGGKGGVVLADYKSPTNFKSAYKQGFMVGITASKQINYDFDIQINLEYAQKGYHHYVCNTIYEKLETTFLQVPLIISYNVPVAEKLKLHLKVGGYGAFWLSGSYKSEGYKPSGDSFDFNSRGAKRFDFGPVGGAEIEYLLLNGNIFGIEFRYDLGLQDMESIEESGKNTNTMMFGGVYYKFILQK